jgi:hypothetical protein
VRIPWWLLKIKYQAAVAAGCTAAAAGYTRPTTPKLCGSNSSSRKLVTRKRGVSEAGNDASLCPLQKFNLTRFLIGRAGGQGVQFACAVIITGVALDGLCQLKLLADIIAR